MSAREVIARALWGVDIGAGSADEVVSCGVPNWMLCLDDADAILSALSAAGYAVVPVEPTRAMLTAAVDRDSAKEPSMYHGIYRAMLAAVEEAARRDALALPHSPP